MEKYVLWGSLVFFLVSCQTEELHRVTSENESLRKELSTCKNEETELKRKEKELLGRVASLEKEIGVLQDTRDYLTKENEVRKTRIEQLERELASLKEDHAYLSKVLEELRFTAQTTREGIHTVEKGQRGLESRSGLVKTTRPDGRVEYFDSSFTSLGGQGVYLSIEEKQDGTLALYLNIQHGYWVVRKDYTVVGITLSRGGRTFPIPYTLKNVEAEEQGGFRKEIIKLPVKGKIVEILKELVQGEGEIHLLIAFPDFSRDRVLSRQEVQGMGNVYYAFREMGGSL